jgi:hypothetical protein
VPPVSAGAGVPWCGVLCCAALCCAVLWRAGSHRRVRAALC